MEGNIARYFKYRKINKYLKSKNSSQYNCLDNLFVYYVNGKLQKLRQMRRVRTRRSQSDGHAGRGAEDNMVRYAGVQFHERGHRPQRVQRRRVFRQDVRQRHDVVPLRRTPRVEVAGGSGNVHPGQLPRGSERTCKRRHFRLPCG